MLKKPILLSTLVILALAAVSCAQAPGTGTPTSTGASSSVTPSPTGGVIEVFPTETLGEGVEVNGDHQSVYIDSYEINKGDTPDAVWITISGNLPTPCHKLHVNVQEPDAQNRIYIEVYSTVKSDAMCAQVLQPFMQRVQVTGLANGSYLLYLNGEKIADLDIPFNG